MALTPEQIAAARAVEVLGLAAAATPLRRVSGQEFAGPCPQCGGEDRFHATPHWFFCRQCHPVRGDAIEFVRGQRPGLGFVAAVTQLTTGAPYPHFTTPRATAPQSTAPHPTLQSGKAGARPAPARQAQTTRRAQLLHAAQARLWGASGEPARAYLASRGLTAATAQAYGLGFRPDVPLPGTHGAQRAPALVIPWQTRPDAAPYALRYRFLPPPAADTTGEAAPRRAVKLTAEPGSCFAGKLFGAQALPD